MLIGASALAGLLAVAGCTASASHGLSASEMVIVFAPNVTRSQVDAARRNCNGVGGAKAERPGPDNAASRANPLRFDVTGLGSIQQAKLAQCLAKQPGVRGYTTEDSGAGG